MTTNYDQTKVAELINQAKDSTQKAASHEAKFIDILAYLQRTARYKELLRYKAATFNQFLSDEFMLTFSNYNKRRRAYFNHPIETKKWGIGKIAKIIDTCGPTKVKQVVEDLDKLKNPTNSSVSKIISKHAKTKKPIKKTVNDFKSTSAVLESKNVDLTATIKEYQRIEKALEEQIRKLSAALKNKKEENERLLKENQNLKAQLTGFGNIFNQVHDVIQPITKRV